MKTKAYS